MARVPPTPYAGWSAYVRAVIPGLALCLVLGGLAKWLDDALIPDSLFVFNYVLLAIVLGLLVRNASPFSLDIFEPGFAFASRTCLFVGVVLLGAQLNLAEVFSIGSTAILMVTLSITFCILICGWFAKRAWGAERLGHLVGVGIGVCGVSAILATAPAIKAREKEIVTAIGAALLTDVVVLVSLPVLGHALGWGDMLAGFIAGIVPSNTAQCIAVGYAYSEGAGAIGTIVKSARNATMPLVILVLTYVYTRRGLPVGEEVRLRLLWARFPKFIVGLLLAATLATAGLLSAPTVALAGSLSTWFFVTCFVGIGAGIRFGDLRGQDLAVMGLGFPMTLILWGYVYLVSRLVLVF